jgi:hypothetical protein
MANLTMALNSRSLKDWQAGLAYLVVVQLFKKFSPDDGLSRVELRLTFLNAVSMRDKEDPSILFEQVSAIQNRYDTANHQIDEE